MLQNAYFLAKIGADTAENEQHFAEILPTDALWRRFGAGGQHNMTEVDYSPSTMGSCLCLRVPDGPAALDGQFLAKFRQNVARFRLYRHRFLQENAFCSISQNLPDHQAEIFKILQIFGGLVLGCIKTKFCKKICVRQHFSSSTRFASFCTAAISKISQNNRFEKTAIFVKFQ